MLNGLRLGIAVLRSAANRVGPHEYGCFCVPPHAEALRRERVSVCAPLGRDHVQDVVMLATYGTMSMYRHREEVCCDPICSRFATVRDVCEGCGVAVPRSFQLHAVRFCKIL